MMEENSNNKIIRNNVFKSRGRKRLIIRWLLERGVRLGRNVIMAAAVVSSAPLVLPPLLAISAVGFVVWVPAGVVVAGYAAVEKLMAALLPLPQLPSSSTPHDDDEKDFDEEGEEVFAIDENLTEGVGECLKREDGGGKDVIGEYGNLEEKGCEDDGGKWLEEKCYEDDGEKCIQGEEGEAMEITTCVSLEEECNVDDFSKSLEEGGRADDKYLNLEGADEYLEGGEQWGFEEIPVEGDDDDDDDDGECLEGKNEININAHSLKEGYMEEPNESEEEDLKNVSNPFESGPKYASDGRDYSECSVDYTCTIISAEEENAGEQEGSLGSHAAERSNDVETKESADEPSTEVMAMISEEKIQVDLERDLVAKGVDEKDVNGEHCERMGGEGKVIAIDENVEVYLESEHGEGEDDPIHEDLRKGCYVEEVGEYLEGEDEENKNEDLEKKKAYEDEDVGNYLEEEQGGAAIDWNSEDGERSDDKKETNNARISKVEVEKESRCGIGESLLQKDEPNANEEMDISVKDDVNAQASEESVAETEKQRSVGEDLKNDSTPLESGRKYASDGTGSEPSSTDDYTCTLVSMEEGNVGEQEDSMGSHTLECSTSIIKTKESAESSNEVMGTMSEEKIWEQVSAIRAILGYKDAKQRSTVDEIKALFVFIGVEPPSPFDDPSHLTDVYQKLKILMSIVGTK
ncbi:unnamed protein product [Cuscuta campestris]|uniref:Uncharacterized protein n=1 Tax=Cuscuta campestris TaxID=132261 RepID=A0A484MUM8_9ASTE|nr:unnamed protein product [Cuscuta campestris]